MGNIKAHMLPFHKWKPQKFHFRRKLKRLLKEKEENTAHSGLQNSREKTREVQKQPEGGNKTGSLNMARSKRWQSGERWQEGRINRVANY